MEKKRILGNKKNKSQILKQVWILALALQLLAL